MPALKKLYIIFFVVSCIVPVCSDSYAIPSTRVIYTENQSQSGWWEYRFTLYNVSSASESLYSIWLDSPEEFSIDGTSLPSGWEDSLWMSGHTTDWIYSFATSPSYEIAAGSMLGGFGFLSDRRLGDIAYTAYFDANGTTDYTRGMSAMASEPVSALLFVAGGVLFIIRIGLKELRAG